MEPLSRGYRGSQGPTAPPWMKARPSPALQGMGRKRMKMSDEERNGKEMATSVTKHGVPSSVLKVTVPKADEYYSKKYKDVSTVIDYSNPSAFSDMMDGLESNQFGSVTKEIEALMAQRMQILNPFYTMYPELASKPLNEVETERTDAKVIDLDNDDDLKAVVNHQAPPSVVIVDSDDENGGYKKPSYPFQGIFLSNPAAAFLFENPMVHVNAADKKPIYPFQELFLGNPFSVSPLENPMTRNALQHEIPKNEEKSLNALVENGKDKGEYVGPEEDSEFDLDNQHVEDDGLGDMWNEMSLAIELSKAAVDEPSEDESEDDGDCDHSFVLKDDLGYVCRICGVIQRGIETIFDFQYIKTARTRTYKSESQDIRDIEPSKMFPDGIKLSSQDFTVTEIAAHPRHSKQMKPHQIEGFNFLSSNLVNDNPGGCILAHAPGSGKTFMIISFMQSFLAKYPHARPLVVLPKGILPIWKKEFKTWQVEDIPLYDFYSAKADSRAQQLEVLKEWVEKKSILFLGYKQFASIVCGNTTSKVAAACEEILLKAPSILILDEGHTPRNENTDVLHSLAKVQTPRKVVLSGTLYQNHVKEVFNILNLVRPKFLKLDTSRTVVKRILSKVQIGGVRKKLNTNGDFAFYDLVEHTLQKDEDFRRKISVIQDLREMTQNVLHYYKGDFLDELPGLEDFTVLLNLSKRQRLEVEYLKKRSETKFKRTSVGSAIYLHPQLKIFSETLSAADDKLSYVNDAKIDEMLETLNVREGVKAKFFLNILGLCESAGEKLLVFSQYLLPLKFLERLAKKAKNWSPGKETFMISGESTTEMREQSMEQFNKSPDARVFFGSIKACGEGISLVGASRIIILDVHLNPSVTRQAIGRAFRPGQKKKVYAYRLIAANSPEEEDHLTCFRKESISRMWFEWTEYCGYREFEIQTTEANESGDIFLETPLLQEDVKVLYRR
uniref:Uncharacterized protein n=1 Tax=Kalanchoe fedtschenkoi TaxID=63787 RepID=A0A7N0T4L4_KALFE